MLPLPWETGPDQLPPTMAGRATAGRGAAVVGRADGEDVWPDVLPAPAGWFADAGLTFEPLPEPADWSTCTARTMASTQTTAAAAQPMTLARCGRAEAAGGRVPSAGSAAVRTPAPAARRDPSASTPAG